MRLTIKGTGLIDCGGTVADLGKEEYSKRYHEKCASAHIKLGELEDIEDELGIDLVTLFKVLKGGIFVDGDSTRKYVFLDVDEKELFTINDFECAYFAASLSQYGKTWALTKEELK